MLISVIIPHQPVFHFGNASPSQKRKSSLTPPHDNELVTVLCIQYSILYGFLLCELCWKHVIHDAHDTCVFAEMCLCLRAFPKNIVRETKTLSEVKNINTTAEQNIGAIWESISASISLQKVILVEPQAALGQAETNLGLVAGPSLTDPAGG